MAPSKVIRLIAVLMTDALPQELPDRVGHILIIPAETVHPPDDEDIAFAQKVMKPAPFRSLGKRRCRAGDAIVGDHLVDLEPGLLCLRALMVELLFGRGDAGVENGLAHQDFLLVS